MKNLKYWQLCLAIWLGIASLSCAQNKATFELKEDEKLIDFTTDRFTLPNLHVTPNGKNIIFDVLGDIYQVPIEGGTAKVILQDEHWKRGAKLSPDGKTLAYISDEAGEFQVWTYDLNSHIKRIYPVVESIHYPLTVNWKNNKEILIPSDDGLFSFHIHSDKSIPIRKAKEDEKSILQIINRTLSVNNNTTLAGFQKEGAFWVYDLQKQRDLFVAEISEDKVMSHFKISPSGSSLLYYNKNEVNFYRQQLRRWDFDTNEDKLLFEGDEVSFFSTSNYDYDFINDDLIILDHQGEIVKMNTTTQEFEPIPIQVNIRKKIKKPLQPSPRYIKDSLITAKVLRNPITHKNSDTIYFGAFGKLRSFSKKTGKLKEYYPDKDRFELSPSLSPDGKFLAYTTWNDWEMGHLYVREIFTGKEIQITDTPGRYINPAWSPDGTEIVFIADETEAKMGLGKLTPGSHIFNYNLDLYQIQVFSKERLYSETKANKIERIFTISQLSKRFYPIPVYHPDGESIFIAKRGENIPSYAQINLTTKVTEQEVPIPFHTDEILISPDTKKIAFIFDEKIWLTEFPFSTDLYYSKHSMFIPKEAHYKDGYVTNILLAEAHSIYEIAPSYLYWQDEYTLMWGSAEEVYTYDIRTGETEKIADIKVQKARAVPKTQYALANARIITMNKQDEIIKKGTILIKDNRIEAIGEVEKVTIPENYNIFNLEGKTIIPGFIDVHAHYHLSPYEFINQQEFNYIGNLAYGVTTIYDPSVNVLDYKERSQMVEAGKLTGPRIFSSGNIILESPSTYDFKKIENINDANRIIKSYKKLEVSGPLKEYLVWNKIKRNWLKEAAESYDIGITTHQNYLIFTMSRIINGYSAIEHEIGSSLFQDDIKMLIAQSGVHYTPTFMVSPGIGNLFRDFITAEEPKLIRLNGNILFQNKYGFSHKVTDINKEKFYDKGVDKRKREIARASSMIKYLRSLGSNISVGGHGNPLPGIGTHMELWSFTYRNGLSNYEALKAATLIGAQKISLQEEIGSLVQGKIADLIVLNENPLRDIFNSTDILYTIQNGNIYESDSVNKIFPIIEELKPWGRLSPVVLKNMKDIYIAK